MDTTRASATHTTPDAPLAGTPVVVDVAHAEPAGAPKTPPAPDRPRSRTRRRVKRAAKRVGAVALMLGIGIAGWVTGLYAITAILVFFIVCGALDVARNRPLRYATIDRYFFGNGVLTWLLSPKK